MCSFILFVILSPHDVNDINPAFAKRYGGQCQIRLRAKNATAGKTFKTLR
jgi:hypothetical protein